MNKYRIHILCPRLGITDRGAEVFVYELAKYLQRDFAVTVWVRKTKGQSSMLADLKKYEVQVRYATCIDESHPIASTLYKIHPLRKVLEKLRLDPMGIEMLSFSLVCLPGLFRSGADVLFPVNGIWGVLACQIVRIFTGIPFIYSSQGGIEPPVAFLQPNVYIAIHRYTKSWLLKHFPKLKVVHISNGIDLKRFTPHGEKIVLDLPQPIFITVSALIPTKRIDLTIKAMAKLKSGSLLVLGNGPLKEELTQLGVRLLGSGRFKILAVPNTQIPKYYRSASVFAFAAPEEKGWGLVHLEALACGLPAVVNDEENLRSLIGKAAFYCDVYDANAYSRCLFKASQKHFNSEGRRIAQTVAWETVGKKYSQLLYQIAAKNEKSN